MDKKVIGLKIKKLRSEKSIEIGRKYTGEMLAKDLNISRSYLGDIESGRTYPSEELIEKISNIFKVSKDYLLSEDEEDENSSLIKEESAIYKSKKVNTAEGAIQVLLKQPAIMAFGGFNIDEVPEEDLIELANDILNQIELFGYKRQKNKNKK